MLVFEIKYDGRKHLFDRALREQDALAMSAQARVQGLPDVEIHARLVQCASCCAKEMRRVVFFDDTVLCGGCAVRRKAVA